MLEAASNPSRPFFLTFTYSNENLPEDDATAVSNLQKFWKRFRKAGYRPRYFAVTEKGSKTNRLHHHAILWDHELDQQMSREAWETISEHWPHGFIGPKHGLNIRVKTPRGLKYCAKYTTKEDNPHQWSKRPMLGKAALDWWKHGIRQRHRMRPYENISEIPKVYIANVLGKRQKIFIPEHDCIRLAKELGVHLSTSDYIYSVLTGAPAGSLPTLLKPRLADGEENNWKALRNGHSAGALEPFRASSDRSPG